MKLLLILLAFGVTLSDFDLNSGLDLVLKWSQNLCLNYTPKSDYESFYAAIVCGSNQISQSRELYFLKTSGLYHLLVVSGSHLVFLAQLIEYFFKKVQPLNIFSNFLKYFVLIIFALMTGLEAPVFRSFITLTYFDISKTRNYHWSASEVAMGSLLTCLFLNSLWIKSFSLLLSHIASLGLILFQNHKPLSKHTGIYLLTLLFLMPIQLPNPIAIFTNLSLSAVVGFLLFPISLLAFIFPILTPLSDQLWRVLLWTLETLSSGAYVLATYPISITWLWMIVFGLNIFMIRKRI